MLKNNYNFEVFFISDIDIYAFKIILFGAESVGKTSLLLRYIKNYFSEDLKKTIGSNFLMKQLDLDNNQIKLVIWDIAGQPRFSKLRKFYYKGSQGALAVFDVTNPDSFSEISEWVLSFRKAVGEDIPMILIGNKIDLDRKIEIYECEALANEFECDFLETSAKTGDNVDIAFEKIARACVEMSITI